MDKGAVYIWKKDVQARMLWMLYSKRLPISKDVARFLAKKYLWRMTYWFDPANNVEWCPLQLTVYRTLRQDKTNPTCVDMLDSYKCVAGIVASMFKTDKKQSIYVLVPHNDAKQHFQNKMVTFLGRDFNGVMGDNTLIVTRDNDVINTVVSGIIFVLDMSHIKSFAGLVVRAKAQQNHPKLQIVCFGDFKHAIQDRNALTVLLGQREVWDQIK